MLGDVFGAIAAFAAIGALIVSIINAMHIKAVHVEINSRMTQLLSLTAHSSRANGVVEGRKEISDRQKS
jgi:hypothetical protein